MENNYCVYMHKNKINGKIYIGQTNDITRRWRNSGIEYKPSSTKKQRPFWNAIQKYGWDNFDHIILEENLSKEESYELEIKYIDKYKSRDKKIGYNVAIGGNGGHIYKEHPKGMLGKHHTDEHKQQKSEFFSDKENNPMTNGQVIWGITHEHPKGMLGKHHTDEHNLSISQKMKDQNINCKKILAIMPSGQQLIFKSRDECINILCIGSTVVDKLRKTGHPYKLHKNTNNNRAYLSMLEGLILINI